MKSQFCIWEGCITFPPKLLILLNNALDLDNGYHLKVFFFLFLMLASHMTKKKKTLRKTIFNIKNKNDKSL